MIGSLLQRVTVRTLDKVVERGRRSERAPVRYAADALDRARVRVGLDKIQTTRPVPPWPDLRVDQPMWPSDRDKLHKWRTDHGVIKPDGDSNNHPVNKPVVKIYFKRGCPYARAAIDLLHERDIEFEQVDFKGDDQTKEWLKIVTGKKTSPQIFVHGKPIGGYDELRGLDQAGELVPLLEQPLGHDGPAVVPSSGGGANNSESEDEITAEELRDRFDDGEYLLALDVREVSELQQTGMLSGAVHIPLRELESRLGELDSTGVWITYCQAGMRSRTAMDVMRSRGFTHVVSLRGGVLAWAQAGGAMVTTSANVPRRSAKTKVRLPVVHPERSPFESVDADWGAGSDNNDERLEGEALVTRVREVIDECRPMVRADGGDITLLDIRDDIVSLELTGNCIGCPSSQATLKQGIERRLKAKIPQIKAIRSPQLQ